MITKENAVNNAWKAYCKRKDLFNVNFKSDVKNAHYHFEIGFRCAWNARTMMNKRAHPVLKAKSPAQNAMEICHTAPNSAMPKQAQLALDI
jgi:hypothetical protein